MKKTGITALLVGLCLMMAVVGFFVLPGELHTQLNLAGQPSNQMPKPLALAIPLLITGFFGYLYYSKRQKAQYLLGALVGIFCLGMLFWLNL